MMLYKQNVYLSISHVIISFAFRRKKNEEQSRAKRTHRNRLIQMHHNYNVNISDN